MLLRLTFAVAAYCVLSSATLADDFAFSDFAETVVIGSISLHNAKVLPAQPVSTITAGKLAVTLEKTSLEDVQAAFGGTILDDGEDGTASPGCAMPHRMRRCGFPRSAAMGPFPR